MGPLFVRIKLLDRSGAPRVGVACVLGVEGQTTELTSDGDGCRARFSPEADSQHLVFQIRSGMAKLESTVP